MMTIQAAIAESQTRDHIVTLEYDAAQIEELKAIADDWVHGKGQEWEFWGHDEDGGWRIHLTPSPEEG